MLYTYVIYSFDSEIFSSNWSFSSCNCSCWSSSFFLHSVSSFCYKIKSDFDCLLRSSDKSWFWDWDWFCLVFDCKNDLWMSVKEKCCSDNENDVESESSMTIADSDLFK